ncbi:MAG: PAS domain-containing protein, partial [Chloroflexales bacterium]|nr:PAS domain-containing protein [Chloroflexales bacterium]
MTLPEPIVESDATPAQMRARISALEAALEAQTRRAEQLAAALRAQTRRADDLQRGKACLAAAAAAAHAARDAAFAVLDTLFAAAPIGLAFFDPHLRFIRINARLAEMNGLSPEAHLGHTMGAILPMIAPLVEPIVRQVLATGVAVCDQEINGATPDAPDLPRDWLASYYPIPGPTGSLRGVGVVVSEITVRKRAEAALRQQTELLTLLLATVGSGVIAADPDGHILVFNPAARQLYGVAQAPESAHAWAAATDLYQADGVTPCPLEQRPLARSLRGEATDDIELVVYHPGAPDGRWMIVAGRPLLAPDGARYGGVIVCRDITQRKHDELALRASEARFRLLAEHAQDLIYRYRLAPTPGFEYISPSATAITGYTPEEHYANPQLGVTLVHPDDRALFQGALANFATAGRPLTLRWQHKDGRVIWTEQVNRLITDAAGRLVAIEGIARDITERKQM